MVYTNPSQKLTIYKLLNTVSFTLRITSSENNLIFYIYQGVSGTSFTIPSILSYCVITI